jgi:hypothetical protein
MIAIDKTAEVKQMAEALYTQSPNWIAFYREIFGLHGIARRMFPTRDDMADFERSEAYQEILRMLTELRGRGPVAADPDEPTRMITVRVPKSLHAALQAEAFERRTTMNKLCISKLLQFIDNEAVPSVP